MKTFFKMNLPNKLTTLRMVAVLIVIAIALIPWNGIKGTGIEAWLYASMANKNIEWVRYTLCGLFIVASFTDMLDGKIARKHNLVTTYGKFMDPIADKLLVNSMFIILTFWSNFTILFLGFIYFFTYFMLFNHFCKDLRL